MTYLSKQDYYEYAHVAFARGLAFSAEGQAKAATEHALECSAFHQAAGMSAYAISYMGLATVALHMQGQLHAAWLTCQHAIQLGSETTHAAFGLIYGRQADVLREWNQLDTALDLALQGHQLSRQPGYELYFPHVCMALVRIHLARGDSEAANKVLQQVAQAPLIVGNSYFHAWLISVEQARLWLAAGDLARATRWAQELAHSERLSSPFAREREDLARARILLAQEKPEEALLLLGSLLEGATKQERWDHVIEMLLLQALAYQMHHEMQQALAVLAQAVSIAQPEGYIRRFLDEGPLMVALLSKLREQERKQGPTPYLDSLLAAFFPERRASQSAPTSEDVSRHPMLDPLTEREQEVLSWLAHGASNQEIAERLVITIDTVKRHVTHIYAKLGVTNRVQGAERGRTLGLLPDLP